MSALVVEHSSSLEAAEALEDSVSVGCQEELVARIRSLFSNSMADEPTGSQSEAKTGASLRSQIFRFDPPKPPDPVTSDSIRGGVFFWNFVSVSDTVEIGLEVATTVEDTISVLKKSGLHRAAKRITYLSSLHREDPDEPEIDLASLKQMVSTIISNPILRRPNLTLTEFGHIHAEWPTTLGGRVVMTFLPSGLADYAAISEAATQGSEIKRVNGRHFVAEAINAVRWFTDRIVSR